MPKALQSIHMRRMWFRLLLPFLALATIQAGTIAAVPNCGSNGTLADLIAFGTSGCEINGLRYFGFSWMQAGGNVTLSASMVDFTATGSGTASELTFSSNSGGFSVSGNQALIYALSYGEDPPPPIIRKVDQQLNDPVTPPGFAKVTTTVCVGSTFVPNACTGPMETLLTYDDGNGNSQLSDSASFGPVGTIGIETLIDLEAKGLVPQSVTSAIRRTLYRSQQLICWWHADWQRWPRSAGNSPSWSRTPCDHRIEPGFPF